MANIQFMGLTGNPVTDDDIKIFANKAALHYIQIDSTQVTDLQPLVDNKDFDNNGGGPGVDPDRVWAGSDSLTAYCISTEIPELQARGVVVSF